MAMPAGPDPTIQISATISLSLGKFLMLTNTRHLHNLTQLKGLKKCQLLSKLNTSYGFYLLLAYSVDAIENAVTHSLQVAQRSLAIFEGVYHIGCEGN